MVIERRGTNVFYPKAAQSMLEIQEKILQIFLENNVGGRMIFPITSPLQVYDDNYNDITKEYLVDFNNSEDEISVFNPEYFTVIKDYNDRYLNGLANQKFHYIQQTLAYTSIERKYIKEDNVIGFFHLNSDDASNDWVKFGSIFSKIASELGKDKHCVEFSNNYTMTAKINNIIVGSGKRNIISNIMEAHYSITDLYNVLNKLKKI